MYLKDLHLVNFKNYTDLNLDFSPNINCLVGNNGEGKTNLLDAVYYLTFCKSFLNPVDSQNIRFGESAMMIQGSFEKNELPYHVHCGIKKGQKKSFKINKKDYEKLADHIGEFPLVVISPADISLIMDGSDLRRKFLDGIIAQYDKSYLDALLQYNKVLNQRNALLKYFAKERTFSQEQLDIWNESMVKLGGELGAKRAKLCEDLVPVFQRYYAKISRSKEEVGLVYESQLLDGEFSKQLEEATQRDIQRQFSNVGVHKDELQFTLNGQGVKKFGSQGQKKSYLIALKLAQFEFLKNIKSQKPILLLDDVFDKLDEGRVAELLTLVNSNEFGQIFVTDTDLERINRILKQLEGDRKVFEVKDQAVKQVLA